MMNLNAIIKKASNSNFYRWLLNWVLSRAIPFNKPHGFNIVSISDRKIEIKIPYQKSNLNHLKGLHACALATVSEYATGLLLISNLDAHQFRLVMKSMHMDYHYQGKMSASAIFELSDDMITQQILSKLESQDSVLVDCVVKVKDKAGNFLSTCATQWQIKKWDKAQLKP